MHSQWMECAAVPCNDRSPKRSRYVEQWQFRFRLAEWFHQVNLQSFAGIPSDTDTPGFQLRKGTVSSLGQCQRVFRINRPAAAIGSWNNLQLATGVKRLVLSGISAAGDWLNCDQGCYEPYSVGAIPRREGENGKIGELDWMRYRFSFLFDVHSFPVPNARARNRSRRSAEDCSFQLTLLRCVRTFPRRGRNRGAGWRPHRQRPPPSPRCCLRTSNSATRRGPWLTRVVSRRCATPSFPRRRLLRLVSTNCSPMSSGQGGQPTRAPTLPEPHHHRPLQPRIMSATLASVSTNAPIT